MTGCDRALRLGTVALACLSAAFPAASGAAPAKRLGVLARGSVVTVASGEGAATAFAVGGLVLTAREALHGKDVHLLTADGRGAVARASSTASGVTRLSTTLRLPNLHAATVPSSRASRRAYVLLAPLGARASRPMPVIVPGSRSQLRRLHGTLPRTAVGAPVVTPSGSVLGVVTTVAHGRGSYVPLSVATAAAKDRQDDASRWLVVGAAAGVALLVLAAAGLWLLVRRRRAQAPEAPGRSRDVDEDVPAPVPSPSPGADGADDAPTERLPVQPVVQAPPLVARRAAAAPAETSDDFEIVLRSPKEGDVDPA